MNNLKFKSPVNQHFTQSNIKIKRNVKYKTLNIKCKIVHSEPSSGVLLVNLILLAKKMKKNEIHPIKSSFSCLLLIFLFIFASK